MTSRRQNIIDAIVAALTAAAPTGCNVRKGRKAPENENMLPLIQVYWHMEQAKGIGNPRRPSLMQRNMTLEVKITVSGDDAAFDAESQWVIASLFAAGNLGGLVTNLSEAETQPFLEDSSVNDAITAGAVRYMVEYTTLPGDLTAAN